MIKPKRKSNNPSGRPKQHGPTEMVSRRIPTSIMDKVRSMSDNSTQFIIQALNEKIDRDSIL